MRGSIRIRLTLAFIGLAIGPLLLVGVILAWQSFTIQEQQALNLQHEVAQRVSFQIEAFLGGLENELRLVNQMQGLQKLDQEEQRDVLGKLLTYQDAFESLNLLDSQGQEQVHLARSRVIPAEELGNRAKADEFVIPQTSGQTHYSPVHFDEITGEPLITIAVPLLDVRTGLVDGVLVSEVRLRRIWDLIMNLRTSPDQSVYIVDARNQVVAHRNPSVVLGGTTFHVPDQDGIQPGLASVSPLLAVDTHAGLSIQSLVARLTSPNVVLVVDTVRFGGQAFNIIAEQTVAEALALAITTILVTVSLIVAALVMSVVLGFVIVRQIVQPIQAMATTAQAISAGDLSRQVQVTSRDEVGILAAAFNSMTAQLRQNMGSLEQQIVEVKQAEESLRQANETLQALIDYSPLAIIMLDLNGYILLWNNAAEKMYGWTAQEALGEFIPFVPEDKREELRATRERVTQGNVFTNLELEWRHKDGTRILVGVSIAPLRDSTGSVYAHMSIATDITKRKKAEQALRESEERLRQIASSLREVIWLRDVQTRQVLYVNPAFEELTGRTCESFYENQDIVRDAIHPDDKEWVSQALEQRFEDVPFDKEHRIIHLDGSVRWVSSRSFPVRNEAGEVYRWASIMEDITERKQAEEELGAHRDHLEELVGERTAELIVAKDAAEEARRLAEAASQAKSTFLANMSHELRTPLNAILGYAQILQRRPLDPDVINALNTVQRSGEHLLTLINDILDIARIEASRLELFPTPIHLPGFLDHVASIIRARAEAKGLGFTFEKSSAIPVGVQADETRLRQVLLNLLDNAVKFTDQGGVVLSVGVCEYESEAPSHPHTPTLRFSVRDTGIGIPPDQVERIFQPFEQVGHATRWTSGTGLGLAISHQLVHLMGGDLQVESEVDRGSTFWFEIGLPVTEMAADAVQSPERVITGYRGPRCTVLVVDDVPSSRAILVDLLQPLGFEVVEAADGQQALHLAQELRPDLILMDRWMPGLDGFEAAQRMRQIPELREVPIVAVSASVSKKDQEQSREVGIDAFLPKPVSWPRLAALLQECLALEWEYEEQRSGGAEEQERRLSPAPLVPPSEEEMEILLDLARRGDMRAIRERTAHIETLGEQYVPFARRLRELAKSFEERRIRTLIEQYVEKDQ